MSKKAEQAALIAYPKYSAENIEDVSKAKHFFKKGYEQAEEDLALTWNDIAIIDDMLREVANCYATIDLSELTREDFYSEVLNRFNKIKEEMK